MTTSLVIQYTPKQRTVSFQIFDICMPIDSNVPWMQILSSSRYWGKNVGGGKAPENIPHQESNPTQLRALSVWINVAILFW